MRRTTYRFTVLLAVLAVAFRVSAQVPATNTSPAPTPAPSSPAPSAATTTTAANPAAPASTPAPATTAAADALHQALAAWRAKKNDDALQAVDQAEKLGAPIADVIALRIQILLSLADADGLGQWMPNSSEPPPNLGPDQLDARRVLIERALTDTERYRDEKLESKITPALTPDPRERFGYRTDRTLAEVAYLASKILVLLEKSQSPHTDDFRQKLRAETGYDPLHGKNGSMVGSGAVPNNGNTSDIFADDWPATMDEELAYYRLEFVDTEAWTPNSILGSAGQRFCARFLPTEEARLKAWDAFVDSLQNSPNSQRLFLVLKTHNSNPQVADAAYRDYINYLYTKRDWLGTTDNYDPVFGDVFRIAPEVAARNVAVTLPLLHALLNTPKPGQWSFQELRLLWQPQGFDVADAPTLWLEINGYLRRRTDLVMQKEGRPDESLIMQMDQLLTQFRNKFPEAAAIPLPVPAGAAPNEPPLVVHKFWCPFLQGGVGDDAKMVILNNYVAGAKGQLFVAGFLTQADKGEIFAIHLPDLVTTPIDTVDGRNVPNMVWTPRAIYSIPGSERPPQGGLHTRIARYDFANGAWAQHTVTNGFYPESLFASGDDVYFSGNMPFGTPNHPSNLVKYDWFSGKETMLADSTRQPAQNQFDDCASYGIVGIYPGPGGRTAVTTSTGTFYLQETPGNWPPVFPGRFMDSVIHSGDRTLVFNQMGEATLIDPKLPAPMPWMASDVPIYRTPKGAPGDQGAVPTPWAAQAIFDCPPGRQKNMDSSKLAFHGDRLFILTKPDPLADDYALEIYDQARGRKAALVPLQLQLSAGDRAGLAGRDFGFGMKVDNLEHPKRAFPLRLYGTDEGLCLHIMQAGFWFIPYADVDAYLQSHPAK